ncbi:MULTISPECIES: alcohol dehydrogenase catalytic domain-containing protein [Mycobacteriaceae]|nr:MULTISPECIES: alcohol dehydrogenase catalytic domain-containing protein [Mycobacteriaceae]
MRAAVMSGVGAPRLVDIAVPEPGPGEVRVAVRACGVCGSDLHLIDGDIPVPEIPLILGHEASGVIDKVGPGVSAPVAPGDRVLVNPIVVCGTCRACRAGRTNQCPDNIVLGVARGRGGRLRGRTCGQRPPDTGIDRLRHRGDHGRCGGRAVPCHPDRRGARG